ncbi:MAG: Activator of Hsp90 ATPase 1-like protein [Chloroflexota bacterium]|jgi:uncharacterized protein YndB with AHSA1/START domain|nr:Activator of Hsp90 ATPase 1-like protein [Chloroflexota bacterium]
MPSDLRVEHQAEVPGRRKDLFRLVSTSDGLARWLDGADLTSAVGGTVRLRLREAVAAGQVLAIDPPQHISWTWDWEGAPLRVPTVVAFDLIDHAERTHMTIRHVGFRSRAQMQIHDALWRHWFGRLAAAARREAAQHRHDTVTQPGP